MLYSWLVTTVIISGFVSSSEPAKGGLSIPEVKETAASPKPKHRPVDRRKLHLDLSALASSSPARIGGTRSDETRLSRHASDTMVPKKRGAAPVASLDSDEGASPNESRKISSDDHRWLAPRVKSQNPKRTSPTRQMKAKTIHPAGNYEPEIAALRLKLSSSASSTSASPTTSRSASGDNTPKRSDETK